MNNPKKVAKDSYEIRCETSRCSSSMSMYATVPDEVMKYALLDNWSCIDGRWYCPRCVKKLNGGLPLTQEIASMLDRYGAGSKCIQPIVKVACDIVSKKLNRIPQAAVGDAVGRMSKARLVDEALWSLACQLPKVFLRPFDTEVDFEKATRTIWNDVVEMFGARGLTALVGELPDYRHEVRARLEIHLLEKLTADDSEFDELEGVEIMDNPLFSYTASVLNVMIASPGDVPEERNIARDVIYEWNNVHAESQGVVLVPKRWEEHASPAMGARPQEIVNSQVLKNCGLLVAIFWTRIGSPTGVSTSGTVEEIEQHISLGKPAMIYFSNAPIPPDEIDQVQYQALVEFREHCKSSGYIETFNSAQDFRQKFSSQLGQTLNREFARSFDTNEAQGPIENAEQINSLSYRDGAYWDGSGDGPFCVPCWDRENKLMRLVGDGVYRCHTCKYEHITEAEARRIEDEFGDGFMQV